MVKPVDGRVTSPSVLRGLFAMAVAALVFGAPGVGADPVTPASASGGCSAPGGIQPQAICSFVAECPYSNKQCEFELEIIAMGGPWVEGRIGLGQQPTVRVCDFPLGCDGTRPLFLSARQFITVTCEARGYNGLPVLYAEVPSCTALLLN